MDYNIIIKKNSKGIIYGMLLLVLVIRLLESFGVPHAAIFLLDGLNCILVGNLIVSGKIDNWIRHPLLKWQLVVIIFGIFSSIVHLVSFPLILWSLRNIFRFDIFYFACAEFLDEKDVDDFFKGFTILYYINVFVILFQYLFLGLKGDYLGGIFGTEQGANSYMNIFLLIMTSWIIVRWVTKKEKFMLMVVMVLTGMFECVLCEIKVYFIELVFVIVVVFVIDTVIEGKIELLFKGIVLGVVVLVALLISIEALTAMYPNFANFFSLEGMLREATREGGYSNSGDLNRLTAIKTINKKVFNQDILLKIFGLGLGATEYSSSISLFTGDFYHQYKYLHYYWFSSAWMYLEVGYIGFFGYILGFIAHGFNGMKKTKKMKKRKKDISFMLTAICLCFCTTLLYLYNQSLRLECAYLLYFCFAIIDIGGKERELRARSTDQCYSSGI